MSGFKFASALTILFGLTLAASACAPGVPSSAQPSGAPVTPPGDAIPINGAGATFPYPLYSRWFFEYAKIDPQARFNYQSIGSGGGIAQITAKTVDFGASDAILSDDQYKAAPGLQMLPTVAGAVVPVYNLRGDDGKPVTTPIKFPYTAIADIFLGKIKQWNDTVLTKANPDLKLPAKAIIVVHRSDGSGTTFIFSDYVSKVSPQWKSDVGAGTSVKWPTGLGGKGNEGVAGTVAQNEGAIGYVELAYALQNQLPYGMVQNKAGQYVSAASESVQSAMADFGTDLGDKLAISIVDPPGKSSWPIAGYTYLLVYMDQTDCAKARKLVGFLRWAYGDGSKFATELQYVPLPDSVVKQVLDKLGKVTCNGKPL